MRCRFIARDFTLSHVSQNDSLLDFRHCASFNCHGSLEVYSTFQTNNSSTDIWHVGVSDSKMQLNGISFQNIKHFKI